MDRKSADAILEKFNDAAKACHGEYGCAYLAGYYRSTILTLLEQLKPNEVMSQLMSFEKEARRLEREAVEAVLKEEL